MSSTATLSYIVRHEDETEIRLDTVAQVCEYLDQAAVNPTADFTVLADHGRRPSLLKRLFGLSEQMVSPCFCLARAAGAATLTFTDDNWSEYRAIDPERPSNVTADIRKRLSDGEPTPADQELCMAAARAFAAARHFMLQGVRPDWLSYRYVR
jgi:hypothetical protein